MGKRVLHGHTSQETAYVVEDYPYGQTLRCKIRYWIETNGKHGQRVMSQTTNPKAGNLWTNKPKASTYTDFAILYIDEETGHVKSAGLHALAGWPENFAQFDADFKGQLDDEQQKRRDECERVSRKYSPNEWAKWEAKQNEG